MGWSLKLTNISYSVYPLVLKVKYRSIKSSAIGHLCFHLGTLDARGRDDFWHLWVGEGFQCLGHYGWLTYISVGYPKMPLQILHCPGEIV